MRLRHAFAIAASLSGLARAADLNVIRAVQVADEGGSIVITVKGSKAPSFTTFSMADPPRFVIDISESRFEGVPEDVVVRDGVVNVVKSLSYGSDATSIARVMIAFMVEVDPPDVAASGSSLLVRVARPAGAAVAKADDRGRKEAEARAEKERRERESAELAASQAAALAAVQAEASARAETEARARADAEARAASERQVKEAAAAATAAKAEAAARAEQAEKSRREEEARAAAEAEERARSEALAREEAAAKAAREAEVRRAAQAVLAAPEGDAAKGEGPSAEGEQAPAADRRRAALEPEAFIGAPRAELREIGFKQVAGASRVFVRTSVTPRFTVQDVGANTIRVELENTRSLRRNDRRFLDTSFFASAVAMVSPSRRGKSYVVDIKLKERVPFQQRIEGDMLAIDFERPARGSAPSPAADDPGSLLAPPSGDDLPPAEGGEPAPGPAHSAN